MTVLTLYSRPGCHLCEEMKIVIDRATAGRSIELREVDISVDPELERRYGTEIPVLEMDGRRIAKYRIDATRLEAALARRSAPL